MRYFICEKGHSFVVQAFMLKNEKKIYCTRCSSTKLEEITEKEYKKNTGRLPKKHKTKKILLPTLRSRYGDKRMFKKERGVLVSNEKEMK